MPVFTRDTPDVFFDLAALSARERYKLIVSTIVPRPIAWVVTLDRNGKLNAAPFSFFNAFSTDPPVVGIGIGSRDSGCPKDTCSNIRDTRQFVVNLVSEEMAAAMNITAIQFDPGVSELAEAQLDTIPSSYIDAPRIAGAPVALECELLQVIDLGAENALVLGRVLAVHVRKDAVVDPVRLSIDASQLRLIARMHTPWYSRTSDLFPMQRISRELWAAANSKVTVTSAEPDPSSL